MILEAVDGRTIQPLTQDRQISSMEINDRHSWGCGPKSLPCVLSHQTPTSLWVRWCTKHRSCNWVFTLKQKKIHVALTNTKDDTLFLSSEKRKITVPVRPREVLPGAPVRAKFHPTRRIQDAKLPQERKPTSHSNIQQVVFSVWGPHTT